MLNNMDILGVILAAAIAGIGSGIGVAIGQALYKALLEDKINKFLDKKHREEALKKLTEAPANSVFFGQDTDTPSRPVIKPINSEAVVNRMLGK